MSDQRRTVLVISPSLGIGGREKIAINTVKCFENLGYHTILVIFQNRDVEYPFEGELINLHVPANKGMAGKVIAQIRRSCKLLRLRKKYFVQFVYSLGDASNITNVLSGLTHHGKSLISLHVSGEVNDSKISRFIFSRSYKVICIAQDMQHYLLTLFPQLTNTCVIENGYELPYITKKEGTARTHSLRLVTMGRLMYQKGLDRLIDAMAFIVKYIPDATLTIIGRGELEDDLKRQSEQLGLQKSITFLGYLSDPFPVLQAHDIYAMTSHTEGFPNALIEALNCGLPIVAADCRTGPREILSEEYTPEPVHDIKRERYGVLVENGQEGFAERFAEAVIQLWNNNKDMERYCAAGPDRAKEFSLERYQDKLGKLLDE